MKELGPLTKLFLLSLFFIVAFSPLAYLIYKILSNLIHIEVTL